MGPCKCIDECAPQTRALDESVAMREVCYRFFEDGFRQVSDKVSL
jgi:hypothetical protein